jgi:hypothetical protein
MGFISWFTNYRSILVNKERISFQTYIHINSRAQVNILIGFVALAWVITPVTYYNNLWNSKALPIVSNRVFTSDGYVYNVSAILDSHLRLNETAYEEYGLLFLYSKKSYS